MLVRLAYLKKYILALSDSFLVFLGYLLLYLLFFGNETHSFSLYSLLSSAYVAGVVYILTLYFLKVYNNILRFSSIREYAFCYAGCILSSFFVSLLSHFFPAVVSLPYNVMVGFIIGALTVGVRVAIRVYLHYAFKGQEGKKLNLLIIGAGAAGNMVIKEIFATKQKNFRVVGLIDDDKSKRNCTISGIKVLGDRNRIPDVCRKLNVDMILFAIPTACNETRKEIIEICNRTKCKVRILPSINDLILTKRMFDNFRDLEVADLLPREPVVLDNENIKEYIRNQVVLVTGGGGSIGSELCRQIIKFNPKKLLILDIYENNAYDIENELKGHYPHHDVEVLIASVRDKGRLDQIFSAYKPRLVFHAAAHKHVPLMEHNSCEAVKNNIFGTLNTAQCADKYGAKKFILISTDKAVNPTNVMGATKRICEMIVQNINTISKTEFVAVRFGNVLGSNGSVLPLFKKQIMEGGPVTVTHKEVTRFFMTIPEAAQLVLQAATYAKGGEIFVLDMGNPVKIYDLAESVIKLSGFEPHKDIEIKITGLRPGEKLYEELLTAEEGLEKTSNQKIYIAQPIPMDFQKLLAQFERLSRGIHEADNEEIKNIISQIVPTYVRDYDLLSQGSPRDAESVETEFVKVGTMGTLKGTA